MLIGIAAATAVVFCVFADGSEADKCREFLLGYGWSTEDKPNERADVNIPAELDEVYKSYNIIQREAGLDITPYLGMSAARYTFTVTNYPIDVGEPVYANVLCVNGEPVAGDIMTVSINGFMHSLSYQEFDY
jgi:hypothetical protein